MDVRHQGRTATEVDEHEGEVVAMCEHHADLVGYLGRTARNIAGQRLGWVCDLLGDASTGVPQWLVVRIPGPRRRYRAIPLVLVLASDRHVLVPVGTDVVRCSPSIRLRCDLTAEEELALHRYWHDR